MNMWNFLSRLGAGAVLVSALLLTTDAAAQTRRQVQDLQLGPDLQGELALKNGDYLLLEGYGRNVPAYNEFSTNRFLGLDQRGIGLTFEHFWSDHWSGGAALQHVSSGGFKYLAPEVLLRHRSPIGPLTFGQRLSVYRTIPFGGLGRSVANDGVTVASLRFDLEKLFSVGSGGFGLRPRLSYEAATRIRWGKKEAYEGDERTIQFTSLRGELGCRVNDHFDFTPWVAYATAYYFTLGSYNPISGTLSNEGRLNLVTPVIGLDARFTLFSGREVFDRRQLPTQH
ncbi:MAG: hypothetical protein JWR44_2672 [Hymenobacter sp.]|jgi:hypothetical protein|nr:hypothetical protein [Hymenobacter sp.]